MKIDIWVASVRLVRDAAGPLEDKPRFKYAVLAMDGVHAASILKDHLMSIWDAAGVVFEVTGLACRGNLIEIDRHCQVEPQGEPHAIATLVMTNARRGG